MIIILFIFSFISVEVIFSQTTIDSLDIIVVGPTSDFDVTGEGSSIHWEKAQWNNIPQRTQLDKLMETKFKIMYSDSGLYFLFFCEDEKISSPFNADFMRLWEGDVVEIFLWPDQSIPAYFEYELSPLNYELPLLISNERGDLVRWVPFMYEEGKQAIHKTQVIKASSESNGEIDGWYAEIYLPFKLLRPLRNISIDPGTQWRANLYRVDYDEGRITWSWKKTKKNFHEYKKFGIMKFE